MATARADIFNSRWTGPILAVVLLAGLIVVVGALPTPLDGAPSDQTATTTVRVSPGQTLWDIAETHRLPGRSTAQTVQAIMDMNERQDSALRAGEDIVIPITGTEGSVVAQADGRPTAD